MRAPSEAAVTVRWPQTLADAIGGRPWGWARLAELAPSQVLEAAIRHGVAPLLASSVPDDFPQALTDALEAEGVRAAARDAITHAALYTLTAAIAGASIEALLFKGADLAYSCYPQSYLRPRVDSDLLIAEAARPRARAVLNQLGYEPVPQSGGNLLMYQEPFVLREGTLVLHTVDLHWRVANPQYFRDVAPFEDLWTSSEPRPRLGNAARGLAPVEAFVLACVHRVAHHYDDERLIWTHDLHRLGQRMTEGDWQGLTALARSRRAAAACARGVTLTTSLFGTIVPPGVAKALAEAAEREPRTARYFGHGRHVDRILTDLSLMPSWTARARLARQHVFPPAQYMRDVYAPGSDLPVAILYMRRAWRGARRWMARA